MRGGIFDLYPPGEGSPVRLDFFGDTIESIRWFDAQSQRSEDTLDGVRVLPLFLFPGGPEEAMELADQVAAQAGDDLDLLPEIAERLTDLRERGRFPGWENLLPLLVDAGKIASLADILPEALIFAVDPQALEAEAVHHAERMAADFEARREHGRLAVPPEALEKPLDERAGDPRSGARSACATWCSARARGRRSSTFMPSTTDLFHGQLPRFPQEVATARARGERCILVVSPLHRDRMEELLEGREVAIGQGGVEITAGELARGFRFPAAGVVVYGEQQLLSQAKLQRRVQRARYGPFVSSLRDLKIGDYVGPLRPRYRPVRGPPLGGGRAGQRLPAVDAQGSPLRRPRRPR